MLHLAGLNLTFGMTEYCCLERRLERTGLSCVDRAGGKTSEILLLQLTREACYFVRCELCEMAKQLLQMDGQRDSLLCLLLLKLLLGREDYRTAGQRVVRPNACSSPRGPLTSVHVAAGGGEPTMRQKSSGW
jgi:hypothetical protein